MVIFERVSYLRRSYHTSIIALPSIQPHEKIRRGEVTVRLITKGHLAMTKRHWIIMARSTMLFIDGTTEKSRVRMRVWFSALLR